MNHVLNRLKGNRKLAKLVNEINLYIKNNRSDLSSDTSFIRLSR